MITYYSELKKALEKFDVKELEKFLKKFNHPLYLQFHKAPKKVKMATLCKMITARTDMLGSEQYKQACKWLKDNNMQIGIQLNG